MVTFEVFIPIAAAVLGAIAAIVGRHLYDRYMQPYLDVMVWPISDGKSLDGADCHKYSIIVENKGKKTTENLHFSAYAGENYNCAYHSPKCNEPNPDGRVHFDIAYRNGDTLIFYDKDETKFHSYPVKLNVFVSAKDVKQKEFIFFIQEDRSVIKHEDVAKNHESSKMSPLQP